jgi:hypothetical protein
MIIWPSEVHADVDRARRGVESIARMLEINVDCSFATQWVINVDTKDIKTFLALAKEAANEE